MSQKENQTGGLQKMTKDYEGALQRQIQGGIDPHVQMAAALAVYRGEEKLRKCNPNSIMGSIFEASRLGLSLIKATGEAYLVPFKMKGVYHCTLIVGYRGMIKAAVRSGAVVAVKALQVHQNDAFDFWDSVDGSQDTSGFRLKRELTDRGPLIAVLPIATLPNGTVTWDIMSRAEVERRKEVAKASPVWAAWPEEQALKTGIRWFLKRVPQQQNQDLARVIAADYRGEQGQPSPAMSEDFTAVIDVEAELVSPPPPSEEEYQEMLKKEQEESV